MQNTNTKAVAYSVNFPHTQLLQPDAEQRCGRVCDGSDEGTGSFPGPPVPEGPHEGPHEEAHRDGTQGGPEAPQTQEDQVCRHLAQL